MLETYSVLIMTLKDSLCLEFLDSKHHGNWKWLNFIMGFYNFAKIKKIIFQWTNTCQPSTFKKYIGILFHIFSKFFLYLHSLETNMNLELTGSKYLPLLLGAVKIAFIGVN